jgi:hypothetical protein
MGGLLRLRFGYAEKQAGEQDLGCEGFIDVDERVSPRVCRIEDLELHRSPALVSGGCALLAGLAAVTGSADGGEVGVGVVVTTVDVVDLGGVRAAQVAEAGVAV